MKRHIILGALLGTVLVFTGCKDDYQDWVKPQASAEKAISDPASHGISLAAGAQADITMPVADDNIVIATIQSTKEHVYGVKSISINGAQLPVEVQGNNIVISAFQLDSLAQAQNFSRAAVKRELPTEFYYTIKNVDGKDSLTFKDNITLAVKPEGVPAIDPNGYFVLGDFKDVGWNPSGPKFMEKKSDGVYEVVVETTGDGQNWFKFYCGSTYKGESTGWDDVNSGQMGSIENGTTEMKNLVVWTGDPKWGVQTPTIKGAGKWKITLDMNNCTYTVKEKKAGLDELFLTGSNYGWGATWLKVNAVNNNWGGTSEGEFWTILYLHADEQFKFSPKAAWDGDFGGTQLEVVDEAGAGYSPDGTNCKVANAGWYLLHVYSADMKMVITTPKLYLIGNVTGGWDAGVAANQFTNPTAEDGEFISPAFANSDNVRMYVEVTGADWWRTEFNVFDGKIVVRTEGDQDAVPVTAGQKAHLNFTSMTGSFQ